MSEQADVWTPGAATEGDPASAEAQDSGALPDVVKVMTDMFDDLTKNFVGYLLAGLGPMVVGLVGAFVLLALMFGGMIVPMVIGQAIRQPELGSLVGMVFMLGGYFFGLVAIMGLSAPIGASVSRAMLAHQEEGEELGIGSSFSRMTPDLVRVVGYTFVSFVLAMIGIMMCYLPGLLVGLVLGFAWPAIIVHRMGIFEAMALSFRHVRDHFVWHLGYWGLGLAILFVGQAIPFVGIMIALPFFYGYQIKVYTMVYGTGEAPAVGA